MKFACFEKRALHGSESRDTASELSVVQSEISIVLREAENLWSEINFRLSQEDRLVPWLFLSLVAAAGIRALGEVSDVLVFVTEQPVWLLLIASALLWFPVLSAIAWIDIGLIASYLRGVTAPRLAHLTQVQRSLVTLPVDAGPVSLPLLDPTEGYLSWERFRERAVFRRTRLARTTLPLWIFRSCALYLPSGAFVALWLQIRWGTWGLTTAIEWVVAGVFLILVVLVLRAFVSGSGNLRLVHKTISERTGAE